MTASPPLISIVIPAFYSTTNLIDCLRALVAQTFQDFELIVVNSSPDEETRQIVETEFPDALFIHSPTRLLPHAARNLGLAHARGELLVTIDPDCIPHPDWLAQLVQTSRAGYAIVQGSVEAANKSWRPAGIHLCKRVSLLPGLSPYVPWIVSTINVCYTRAAWLAAGPFDGDLFCADALIGWRAAERGYHSIFEPRAIVENCHNESILDLVRIRLERGTEIAVCRARYENWTVPRMAFVALLLPILFLLVMARSFRYAQSAGWTWLFFATLPVHAAGQLGWIVGESRGYISQLLRIPNENG
jgi:glycosyltransferase involved in cell wall biosynthesis